jgi:hypothetical protein
MKPLIKIFAFLAITNVALADNNCFDDSLFPTTPDKCMCIITNSVNDCIKNAPPTEKKACNAQFLDNLFKTAANTAIAICMKYDTAPIPDDQKRAICTNSITFYDANCPTPPADEQQG